MCLLPHELKINNVLQLLLLTKRRGSFMKRIPFSFLVIATFLISIISVNTANAHPEHCIAGFHACVEVADGDSEAQEDCVNGWFACIGYEPEVY